MNDVSHIAICVSECFVFQILMRNELILGDEFEQVVETQLPPAAKQNMSCNVICYLLPNGAKSFDKARWVVAQVSNVWSRTLENRFAKDLRVNFLLLSIIRLLQILFCFSVKQINRIRTSATFCVTLLCTAKLVGCYSFLIQIWLYFYRMQFLS